MRGKQRQVVRAEGTEWKYEAGGRGEGRGRPADEEGGEERKTSPLKDEKRSKYGCSGRRGGEMKKNERRIKKAYRRTRKKNKRANKDEI